MQKPKLSELTLREKIGQTALGRPSSKGYLDLDKYPYGAIWALGNIDMTVINMAERSGDGKITTPEWIECLNDMNRRSKIPILQAMDCTAGIKASFGDIENMLDPVTMGATDLEEVAFEAGKLRAKMLKAVGSRWVWSPEVDLPNRSCAIMLGRQYSDNPEKLLGMAIADMKGIHSEGVAACAKHFPGSDGMEYRDAHVSENMMLSTVEEWKARQAKMFEGMFEAGVDSVMMAHGSFPFYDNTMRNGHYVPSSLSYKVITELLKGEMDFKGVVITDGIEMRSAVAYCDDNQNKVYVEAIKAGNDIVLGVRDSYFDAIENAVLSGEIPESRIDDACQRVLDLKEKLGMFNDDFNSAEGTPEEVNKLSKDFREWVAKKAVSLVCDKENLFPLNKDKIKNVTIIYSGHDETGSGSVFDSLKDMKESFEKRGATVTVRRSFDRKGQPIEELKKIAESSDLIVYAGYIMRYCPEGPGSLFGDEVLTFHYALRYGREKSVGVGLGSPFMYYDFYSNFPAFINAYNNCTETQEAVVAAMYGEIGFEGKEPFRLVPEWVDNHLKLLNSK